MWKVVSSNAIEMNVDKNRQSVSTAASIGPPPSVNTDWEWEGGKILTLISLIFFRWCLDLWLIQKTVLSILDFRIAKLSFTVSPLKREHCP